MFIYVQELYVCQKHRSNLNNKLFRLLLTYYNYVCLSRHTHDKLLKEISPRFAKVNINYQFHRIIEDFP